MAGSNVSLTFSSKVINERGDVVITGSSALNDGSNTQYTGVFSIPKTARKSHRYVTFFLSADAITGTNIDVALMGANTSGGTKYLLLDAVVADITNGADKVAVVDINAYPMPYYYLRLIADADNKANTLTVKIFVPSID
jgi:hypothetical protein